MKGKIQQAFEDWYDNGLTEKHRALFEVIDREYTLMATRLAYQAFKAGWQAKIEGLKAENQALRDELEAVKAELNSVVSGLHSEKDINKIKADAVRGLIITITGAIKNDYISMREVEEMELEDFCNLAEKHANKLEKGQ